MAVDSLDPVAGLHTPGMLPQLLLVLLLHSAQAAPAPQDEDLPPMPVETSPFSSYVYCSNFYLNPIIKITKKC